MYFINLGSSTTEHELPLILKTKSRREAETYRRTPTENRNTLFECESCTVWFMDMETFYRHPCMTGMMNALN